jgi:hypothetical protein
MDMSGDLFSNPLPFVLILIGFIAICYFVNKFNRGMMNQNVEKAKSDPSIPALAQALGLTREDYSLGEGKDTLYSYGHRIYGDYDGYPLEMIMAQKQDMRQAGIAMTYSTMSQNTITLQVNNPNNSEFQIMPKTKSIVAEETKSPAFNEHLTMTGKMHFPSSLLEYFARLGWMNLTLKGNQLVFRDNFFDQFASVSGAMKIMSVVHPVWGTSVSSTETKPDTVKSFLNKLVEIAKIIDES